MTQRPRAPSLVAGRHAANVFATPMPPPRPPDRWYHYLRYPRIFLTIILCTLAVVLHVAFGLYVWCFEK